MAAAPSVSRAVARFVRRRRLWRSSDRIAIAISGGSDSVALAFILRDLEGVKLGRVAGLIHVNHQLRGADADADEAFCAALAARFGWPIDIARVDVARLAGERHLSIEAAARAARYACFADAAAKLGASVVVTGHTADDQAETVLLRLLRGAGTRGLSGIRARRGIYARPLLECRRVALQRDLLVRGETYRDDRSNLDLAIPRNRLRHALMPVVEQLAPGGVRALARLASLAQDDEAVLTKRAIETARDVVLSPVGPGRAGAIEIDARSLSRVPPAIGRRVLRGVIGEIAPGTAVGAVHLQAVWDLVQADKLKGKLNLPGLAVERRGRVLSVRTSGIEPGTPGTAGRSLSNKEGAALTLEVPGSVDVPAAGVTITATRRAGALDVKAPFGDRRACLQADSVHPPLSVRTRRPGDTFRPLGAPGRRKLQDVLVDRKVPRDERDRVPVVVDARGRVVWVAGVALAEECRVTAPEAGVVILELRAKE